MNDIELSEEQRMIRDMARDFAKTELAPNAEHWEKAGWLDENMLKQMGELGFLGMVVPEEWAAPTSTTLATLLLWKKSQSVVPPPAR